MPHRSKGPSSIWTASNSSTRKWTSSMESSCWSLSSYVSNSHFLLFLVIPSRPFWQTYQCRTICRTARLHSKATSIVKTTDFSIRTWRPKTGCSRLVKSSISTTRRPVSPRKTCVKFSKKTERLSPPKSGFCRTRVKGLFLSFFFS